MKSRTFRFIFETVLCSVFGAIMFASDIMMEAFPNIHLIAMFIVTFTVVFRFKALISVYTYVFLNGLYAGFSQWWIPYLYVWTVLWLVVMLLPKFKSAKFAVPTYIIICALHGLSFGLLYAPVNSLMFGLDFDATVAWVIAGLPFDFTHAVGNFFAGMLCYPLIIALKKTIKRTV